MSLISEQCSQYLLSNNEQSLLYYQSISGIGYNKLGSYLQCVADPRSQYYLINATSQVAAQQTRDIHFMTGICFSRLCSAADLQYALHAFESYSTVPFVV